MKTFLPTEYKQKLLSIKSNEKVYCDNAMLICCELEYHYLQEIRKVQERAKADNEKLMTVIKNATIALSHINENIFPFKKDYTGNMSPESKEINESLTHGL
jgi:hypothetical protein